MIARIQGHPTRAHLHQPLADSLGFETEIRLHSSDPPNPWLGYRACLSDLSDCSHLLVIQDDAEVCVNFTPAIEQIAAASPDKPVVLFLSSHPPRLAKAARMAAKYRNVYVDSRLRINEFMPVVSVLWPRHLAEAFMAWADANPRKLGHGAPRSDDSVAGRWAALTNQAIRVTVPSLVEHDGSLESVKGAPTAASTFRAWFLAENALDYEWNR